MATRNYISKFYSELEELQTFLEKQVPDGTTCNILASDLEAGNFDKATFVQPDGLEIDVHYTGLVAEGYVSPFETRPGVLKEEYRTVGEMESSRWSQIDEEYLEKLELRKDELYGTEGPSEQDRAELAQLTSETIHLRDLREQDTGSRV